MRRIRWLVLALALSSPAAAQPFTGGPIPSATATAALPTSTQSRTTLIKGVAGQYIYVIGWHIIPASGAVVTWSTGTGTNCGTSNVILDGPNTYGTTIAPDNWGGNVGAVMIVPKGQDLCLTIATAAISGSIVTGQF